MFVYMCVHTSVKTQMYPHIQANTHTYTPHILISTVKNIHVYILVYIFWYAYTCIYSGIYSGMRLYNYIPVHIHADISTHTNTYRQINPYIMQA